MIYIILIVIAGLLISVFTRAKFFEVTLALFVVWFAAILLVKFVQLIARSFSKQKSRDGESEAADTARHNGIYDKRMKQIPFALIVVPVSVFSMLGVNAIYKQMSVSVMETSFTMQDLKHIIVYLGIHIAVIFIPIIRRLNDAGRSRQIGWLVLLPFVNLFLILFLLALPSKAQERPAVSATINVEPPALSGLPKLPGSRL